MTVASESTLDLDSCDRCGRQAERIWVGHEPTTGFDGLCDACLDLSQVVLLGLCCADCDARYPDGALHESCAQARIEAESV